MTDHSKQHYYEVVGSKGSDTGPYSWKVYHYDETGNKEIIIARSTSHFKTEAQAINDCVDWLEDNGIEAELS